MKQNRLIWLLVLILLSVSAAACSQDKTTPTPTLKAAETAKPAHTAVPTSTNAPTPTTIIKSGPETVEQDPAAYQNVLWNWVFFSDPAFGEQAVPEPENYQLILNVDGTVDVMADCGDISGTYTVGEGSISIDFDPETLAACPENSMSLQFVQNLSAAAIMFFEGDDMLFDLVFDSGTMRFNASGIAS